MEREYPSYNRDDLGAVYTEERTTFRVWAPTAEKVIIRFYADGHTDSLLFQQEMNHGINGTWFYVLEGDHNGIYYTYRVRIEGKWMREASDPYAVACGVNGNRSMVLDLHRTNPQGFELDHGPLVKNQADIIVAEISVSDATSDRSAHSSYPGKFLGLTESAAASASDKFTTEQNPEQDSVTALDYLADLGVTHVQIMPFYDFGSVDEAHPNKKQYNWGYDPINYNIPEGSYSTDPFHGEVRVRECKSMIQAFHKKNIGVIMDVVYNHVYDAGNSCLQNLCPDYYFRMRDGKFSNGSGCGNEAASEHPMMRKYIIDSLVYWVKEYHVDGFRFDLMGILDIETMNLAAMVLRSINPSIVIYGEGWSGGICALPYEKLAMKLQVKQLNEIGVFSDDIRDHIKGSVFNAEDQGFVNGAHGKENDIRFCVAGAVKHPQVDYENYHYSDGKPWAKNAGQVVNFVSCHDNLTLWDKLYLSSPESTEEQLLEMNRLAAAIIFTSQGITFFLGGEEFARSKPMSGKFKFSANSYNLPVSVNSLKYNQLEKYRKLHDYYKGLIAFRKAHDAFRLYTEKEIASRLVFLDHIPENTVAFEIHTDAETVLVIYNANEKMVRVDLHEDCLWNIQVEGWQAGTKKLGTIHGQAVLQPKSCLCAVKE